ncbi:MAG TPA: TadE/TadG family type IV pilus assembly protein [Bryobacteraceae bacterium]|nr:TadE/TadG family type IV pilus assembly protein [Bryobacteraceae bacterium]
MRFSTPHRLNIFRRDRSGSSLVETAIVLPCLLLMCCGTMDFGRVFYAGIAIASAARAGVQYGALTPGNAGNTTGMTQAAMNDIAGQGLANATATARNFCGCAGSSSEVACSTATCSGATPKGYVEVTVNYTFAPLFNYPGLPGNIVLTRAARMRVQ